VSGLFICPLIHYSETMSDKTKRLESGTEALDFSAETFDGKTVSLWELAGRGPVVLVLLRGFS